MEGGDHSPHSGDTGIPAALPAPPTCPGSFSETEGNEMEIEGRPVCGKFHSAVQLCHLILGTCSPVPICEGALEPQKVEVFPLPWAGHTGSWRLDPGKCLLQPLNAGRWETAVPSQAPTQEIAFCLLGLHTPFHFAGLSPGS